jgi:hypothetical protein
VALALPEGWRRRTEGDLLIAAPVDGGLRLSLRGWAEGDVVVPADGAVPFRTETLAEGLGERLGGKVRCASWQPSEGGASFAWYGVVGGRGFLLVADLPADDFEQAWAELARLLDGLEPR